MPDLAIRTYALSADETGGDGLLPYLNADGAFVGPAVSLLEKDDGGRWRGRPRSTLEALLGLGYGGAIDLEGRMGGLEAVARALNAGDRTRAAIALVHMRLPPLASLDHARRMAQADRFGEFALVKYDPSEPRVPAGDSAGGQWTGGGGAQSHRQKPSRHDRNDYKRVHGVPKDTRVVRYPDGSVVSDERSGKILLAPPNADFPKVYAAGEAIRGESLSDQYGTARTAIAQEGTFDFQRDPSSLLIFDSYANASNYAAGVYMARVGHSWELTWGIMREYAATHSRNYGSPDQTYWFNHGWRDANNGKWK